MTSFNTGIRIMPIKVLDPATGDYIAVAVGVTTTTTAPTSLSQCVYSGSIDAQQQVTTANLGTPLSFNPTVNITTAGTYYGWVFLYLNQILIEVLSITDYLIISLAGGVWQNMTTKNILTGTNKTNTVYQNTGTTPRLVKIEVDVTSSASGYTQATAVCDSNSSPSTVVDLTDGLSLTVLTPQPA